MDLRGFTELGADIGRRVNDSISSGDFSQLNRDIKRTFESAFSGKNNDLYRDGLDGKLYRENENTNKGFDRVYSNPGNTAPGAQPPYNAIVPMGRKIPGKAGSVVMMIFGYLFAAAFGITGFGLGLLTIPAATMDAVSMAIMLAAAGFTVPFTAAGLALGIAGTRRLGMTKRIRMYLDALAGNSFCQISALTARTGKKHAFTVKELKKLVKKGYFPEGHIDDHETCFIGNNATYGQYIAARDSAAAAAAEAREEAVQPADREISQVLEEGNSYLKTIRDANDAIYDPVISEKLFRMEIVVKKIFEYVEHNPKQTGQLRKFMAYYMPTTEKLVKAYQKMDGETVMGSNMNKAKEEIAQTLDTINEAYEKLYDSLHIDVAMDVSSDIAVLKTMFAQEGLSKEELGGN